MNRTGLEAMIASYLHRTDLTSAIVGFIDLATSRLARDLRSSYNEKYVQVTVAADPTPLPDDFRAFRSIAALADGGVRPLRSMGSHELARYKGSGGQSQVYSVVGRNVLIRPYQAGDYQYNYYNAPADLASGNSENLVLTNYPYLYLYASLVEAYVYIQDDALAQKLLGVYSSELALVNDESKKSRTGDAPAMRAV